MAPSSIRKAIGAVKDQTSISIAKVAGNVAPDLEVLIVKATSHDNEPSDDKYIREILTLTSSSNGYVSACVYALSKRMSKTHDWIVAIKSLMLVHRLLLDGDPVLGVEIMYASQRGTRVLNFSDFRDEAHSNSWDHSGFVRTYALYLDQKLEFLLYDKKLNGLGDRQRYDYRYGDYREERSYGMSHTSSSYGDLNESVGREPRHVVTPVREMKTERVLERLNQLLRLLDRFLACRPTGAAKNSRMVLVALYLVVTESFKIYSDICEVLGILLDKFSEMQYTNCVKAFDTYVNAARMIDELVALYSWCKEMGIARSSEFPEVQKITDKLLGTLEGFLRERANGARTERGGEEGLVAVKEETPQNINEIKALPAPENYITPRQVPVSQVVTHQSPAPRVSEDLVNLKDDGVSADEQGNKLALALFSGVAAAASTNGSWETFSSNVEPEVTSAWQTPAADTGKAGWELALVESASNLSKQKADLAGGFDPLLLNGIYDQGILRQYVSSTQLSGGSASSVVLPGVGKTATPILALPTPDGTMQVVGNQDPFASSLAVPPPSYVQIADMERKRHLLMQEQQVWKHYSSNGMQGVIGLAQVSGSSAGYHHGMGLQQSTMPYGMPPVTGMGQLAGYYYAPN